ncbi:MAG: nucleotidyl transferase AbiEii/AbiGii toxin family protein [Pseudomonadales bacterium]
MAAQHGVRDQQIEKDYVLSWILQGISRHEALRQIIAFKGGTLLKKIYFEDYRFSEDLDFTLLDDSITNEQIFEWFEQVFGYIQAESNIPLVIVDNHEHQDGGINFYITYVGPLGGSGAHKRIKIDIARSETLVFEPVYREALLSYSDQTAHKLLCYSLEEVLIEKLRSVMQRMQARDFYDLWYLLKIRGMDAQFLMAEFESKCNAKGLGPEDFPAKLEQRLPQYRARWEQSLREQIPGLPDFGRVEREMRRQLKKLGS